MNKEKARICNHVLDLQPGAEGVINFRFPKDRRTDLTVGLASVDSVHGTAELVLDDLWRGYEMMQFVKGEDRWTSILPRADGTVHAVIVLGAQKNLDISSEDVLYHSLQLTEATWKGGSLHLAFRESGSLANLV